MLKIWLDDVRPVPDFSWLHVANVVEAMELIGTAGSEDWIISFDHDLGPGPTGYDLASWIELKIHHRTITPPVGFLIHSSNPPGAKNIRLAMSKIAPEITTPN